MASVEHAIERIIQDACELPDRTSPEDQPDMMLITGEELDMLLRRHLGLEDAPPSQEGASEGEGEMDDSSSPAVAAPIASKPSAPSATPVAPYPFCDTSKCPHWKGYCRRDPACNE